jgi:uncharacterized membrane protein YvlD (DUF360 family)
MKSSSTLSTLCGFPKWRDDTRLSLWFVWQSLDCIKMMRSEKKSFIIRHSYSVIAAVGLSVRNGTIRPLLVMLYWHDLNDIFVSKFIFENNCIFTKTKPPHAKLTLDGFWLLCLDSFDLLAPNILYFWLSKISVVVVTDDDKSRKTCCAHGIQFLCHTVFL